MTTSRLSTHAFELTANDLQVLADYAIEAPHEWRLLLERVIEIVEAEHEYAELEQKHLDLRDEHEDLKKALKTARDLMARRFFGFRLLIDKTLGPGPSQLRDQFIEVEEYVLDSIDELLEPKESK